ncbi:MAG: type IX secretion system membrane protein PorP/SprF [Brumimicrobium sp.]|nr:type IX secretion system membrane protein PorP/SprF [Brumimicrobium sp.]MCO5269658.1 PorP/SprF family type IX secretion system membrane protein [Brumimicrobium sp.]
MKNLLYSTTFIILLVSGISYGQQQGVYSNFLMNNYYYNPAIAGSTPSSELNLGVRKQWVGFEGSPFILNASFQGSIKNRGKIGLGGSILSENVGITNRLGIYINYAQHFRLFKDVKLGLGVRPGFMQYSAKLYKAILADEDDKTLTGNTYSGSAFDVDMGFNVYSPKFFFMASFNNILRDAIRFAPYNSNLTMHINVIAGYNIKFPKKKFELQPSLMLKYSKPVPLQLCAMLKATYNDMVWVGLLMRTNDAVGISAGAKIKDQLWISYSYDYTLGRLIGYQTGSHEIGLSILINNKKKSLSEKDEELNNSIMDSNKKNIK